MENNTDGQTAGRSIVIIEMKSLSYDEKFDLCISKMSLAKLLVYHVDSFGSPSLLAVGLSF